MAWFLGFDTSNYKTSAGLYDSQTGQSKILGRFLEVPEGALGLRQSDALFQHVRHLGQVVEELMDGLHRQPIAAVGYSSRPRCQQGSYMPCFLAGEMAARTLAGALGVPAFAFSHQQGHIASALWSADKLHWRQKPFLSWHSSGGTTELLRVEPEGDGMLHAQIIGGTQDAAAGQIIDRAGVALGLPFPCGAHLDALAGSHDAIRPFVPKMQGASFSLSGLENKFRQLLSQGQPPEEVAAFVLRSVAEVVARATQWAQAEYQLPVLFSGGVTASTQMQRRLAACGTVCFAQGGCNGDNAIGPALLAALAKGAIS